MLDSGASHNFIAAHKVIDFSYSVKMPFFCSYEPMKMHLSDNYLVISH